MATATKESKIILELTEEEADFIGSITQNPGTNEESVEVRELRTSIYLTLSSLNSIYHE